MPLADGRGISFNPTNPDPGQQVTITGQFSNIGTLENDDSLDAVLMLNGNEIARERFDGVEPVSPSGEGGPLTFSAIIDAELGIHNVTMILDVNKNLTESREDNNIFSVELSLLNPMLHKLKFRQKLLEYRLVQLKLLTLHWLLLVLESQTGPFLGMIVIFPRDGHYPTTQVICSKL